MNKITAFFKILRPINIFLCLLSVIIAAYLINSLMSPLLPYAIIVVICFAGASNILNDVFDINIDKINRPSRILVSGRLTIKEAILFMSLLYCIGILSSLTIKPLGRELALYFCLPILVLYTPFFKGLPLIGNIIIGISLGIVFPFTECAIYGYIDKMWTPFGLATCLSIIRELIKDGADLNGDNIKNIQTLPKKYGLKITLLILKIFTILLCVFSSWQYFNGYYNFIYLILLTLFVNIPLLWVIFITLNNKSSTKDYYYAAKLLKIITVAGMFVILSTGF